MRPPAEHLSWKVLTVVAELDLSEFLARYRCDGQGAAAYRPDMMLALLFYCYSKGIRSSRKIEAACVDDIGCRVITAGQQIDHATIARFVWRHRLSLQGLFVQVLALCAQHGLVDPGVVAVDGSPMLANAARSSNFDLWRLEAIIADTEAELAASTLEEDSSLARMLAIGDRLARARAAVAKLYSRALPAPSEISAKVEAAERMVARAEQRLAKFTARHQDTLRTYALRDEHDRAAGRRRAQGRPPASLDNKAKVVRHRNGLARAKAWLQLVRHPIVVPAATARASLTDPESRLMLGKHGGFVQGYNIQIACSRNQVLLAIELHDNPADKTALVPVIRRTQQNCRTARITQPVRAWVADGGYASTANFTALADVPLLVPVTTNLTTPARQRMAASVATLDGSALYSRRSALVEPGFAQLFQRFGRRLHYRGNSKVDAEIKLLGIVHNLNKLFRHSIHFKS